MTKEVGGKGKVGGVETTERAAEVEGTKAVGGVEAVKPAGAVGGVARTAGVGRRNPTRTMTLAERQGLFRMINEEAEKMLAETGLSEDKRKQVAEAVKMAVDTGLVEEEEEKK